MRINYVERPGCGRTSTFLKPVGQADLFSNVLLVDSGLVVEPLAQHKAGTTNGGGTGSGSGGGNGEGVELDLAPLLIALLKKIPSAEKGWSGPNRLRWFRTFAMNVSQIYDADDNEAVEMKIELESKEAAN